MTTTTKKKSNSSKKPAKSPVEKKTLMDKAKTVARIEKLPKTVTESLPFRGFLQNGIIEVSPGVFTRTYKLEDINFTLASTDEQMRILNDYMDFLNSFAEGMRWQINIFKKEIDKQKTLNQIRLKPQKDGFNKYRGEITQHLANQLKKGNCSVEQSMYLTVSIEDHNVDHAVATLNRADVEIGKKFKEISQKDLLALSVEERAKLLYNIYNPDPDYRIETGIYEGEAKLVLKDLVKNGISIKDAVGPASMDYSKKNFFMLGDIYAKCLYLKRIPASLRCSFLADLADVQCSMLMSLTYEKIPSDNAIKLIKNQLVNIDAKVSQVQKRNLEDGYIGSVSPELEASQASAHDLYNDITARDQNLFFMTMTLTVFAHAKEQLDEYVKSIKSIADKYLAPIEDLNYQQEFGFNTSLPLCRNDLFVEHLVTTESAAAFIPFHAQGVNQRNAIFYGVNTTSKTLAMYDRLSSNNYNGLIFGVPGSGKSFAAKLEMANVFLNHPNAVIRIIDPQGEYTPFVKALKGQVVDLFPGSSDYINPLDLNLTRDEEVDPITLKTDFAMGMIRIMFEDIPIPASAASLIDKCIRKIYEGYIAELNVRGKTYDPALAPTLNDLYQQLRLERDNFPEADEIANRIYRFTVGSFDTFAHRSNVVTNNRIVSYNIQRLGTSMRELALYILVSTIFNEMAENKKMGLYTWMYIDEFHHLLDSERTINYLAQVWKMARKWKGVPTGILQNPGDLASNPAAKTIVKNTEFVLMYKASNMDKQDLGVLFNLSGAQLNAITNTSPGKGLLYASGTIVPIDNSDFPKNTSIYKLIDTKQ